MSKMIDVAAALPVDPQPDGARDRLILEQLLSGNGGALAAALLDGHIPGLAVRQCLGLMLLDWPEAEAAVAAKPALNEDLWRLPFRLVAKARPRKRGRRRSPENDDGEATSANVSRLVGDLAYDAAMARVDEAVATLLKTGREG
jgi:hypothetical protein